MKLKIILKRIQNLTKQGPTLNKSLSCLGCYTTYFTKNTSVNNFSKVS